MAHPKGLLMERLKKQGVSPEFRTANTGPDHEPTFLTDVVVNGEVLGTGQGGNKREAEALAAEEALAFLDRNPLELEAVAPSKSSRSGTKKGDQKAAEARQQPKKAGTKSDADEKKQKAGAGKQAAKSGRATTKSGQETAKSEQETTEQPERDEAQAAAAWDSDRFEGPWPVFENLLAGIVEVAGERVDEELKGEEARIAVRDFTLDLYKDLLEDLGDVVEVEDDE